MAIGIITVVLLCAVGLIFLGPKLTIYSRKQWALLMVTLIILWIPMGWYLIFVIGQPGEVNKDQAVRAAALNLGIGVPVFIFIGRRILKVGR